MRRAERVHHPATLLAMRDESADADDRVIDVLWKLSLIFSSTSASVLPIMPFAAAKPRKSGTVSKSQTITCPFMQQSLAQDLKQEKRRIPLSSSPMDAVVFSHKPSYC